MFTDWTRGDILNLLTMAFSALGAFANAAAVRWAFFRRVLLGSAVLITILVVFVLVWLVQREENIVVAKPPSITRPPVPKPTPMPTPEPRPVDFQVVPEDPEAIKQRYCVVGYFKGSLIPNADAIEVTVTEADLDLCRISGHDSRRIRIRVGVAARGRRVEWSSRTVLTELAPGKSFELSAPVRLSIRTRMPDLSRAVVHVEVENRPADTGQAFRYQLNSSMNQVVAN